MTVAEFRIDEIDRDCVEKMFLILSKSEPELVSDMIRSIWKDPKQVFVSGILSAIDAKISVTDLYVGMLLGVALAKASKDPHIQEIAKAATEITGGTHV